MRTELAWGLDAAWEHYFAKSGVLSVSAFVRCIQDVTIERLSAHNGKWIASPVNDGNAAVRGIELEARMPLAALVAHAPAIGFKFNLSRNWSTLAALPGPNNRLAEQTPLSANIGLDYRANERFSAGGNLGFKSAGPVTVSLFVSNDASPTRTLDLYGVMKLPPLTQWRTSAFNLLHSKTTPAQAPSPTTAAAAAAARSALPVRAATEGCGSRWSTNFQVELGSDSLTAGRRRQKSLCQFKHRHRLDVRGVREHVDDARML